MKRVLWFCFYAAFVVCVSGCATLISGTKQNVIIKTEPEQELDVKVIKDSKSFSVKTPAVVTLDRGRSDVVIKARNSGCYPDITTAKAKINPHTLWNLIWAPVGTMSSVTTDAISGSLWRYDDVIMLDIDNNTCNL